VEIVQQWKEALPSQEAQNDGQACSKPQTKFTTESAQKEGNGMDSKRVGIEREASERNELCFLSLSPCELELVCFLVSLPRRLSVLVIFS